jgi:hypothetical protein
MKINYFGFLNVLLEEHPELDLRSRAQVVNFALRLLFRGKK